jgi:hypothetical protein
MLGAGPSKTVATTCVNAEIGGAVLARPHAPDGRFP